MSLIKCPECGKEISDQADICINCGFNLSKHQQIQAINEEFDRMLDEEIVRIQNTKPPTIPKNLGDVESHRNDETLEYLFLMLGILSIIACPLVWKIYDTPEGGFLLFMSVLFFIGYLFGRNLNKKTLKEEQERVRNEIDNFEKTKLTYIRWAEESIEERRQSRIKELTTPSNQANQKQSVDTRMRCPVCGSTRIAKISTTSRIVSTAMVGIASSKIGKQWHCNNCKTDF
jgi:hypothetical protein